MNCVIPGANIKIMSRALQALAKIGDELYIEAKKEYLQLAVINMNKTVYSTFHFFETFFTSYDVAELEPNSENIENITCKIHMKAMLGIFRMKWAKEKDRNVEFCKMELENDATKLIIKKCRQGLTIVHSLRLIDMEFVAVSYSVDDFNNQIGASAHFFTQVAMNFQLSDDNLSFEVDKDKMTVRNYDVDASNVARCMRSQVVLNSNEFSTYKIMQKTNVTISFKPFRAAIHFAEAFSLNVMLNFKTGGKPLILVMKTPTYEVNFVLSTINPYGATQTSVATTPSLSKISNKKCFNTQDKCDLDDINWDREFDANEVTNKRIGADITNVKQTVVIADDEVIPQSPESPRTKRMKMVFGRCFEPTFHSSMLDLGEVLAPDSDPDSDA